MLPEVPYIEIGKAKGVRQLVDLFYDFMDQLPEASHIRPLHAKSLRGSREKLFKFLSGWLGGPNLYIEEYGHPRLRRRHMPFKIGQQETDEWMFCMKKALAEMDLSAEFSKQLIESFQRTADHMRNI